MLKQFFVNIFSDETLSNPLRHCSPIPSRINALFLLSEAQFCLSVLWELGSCRLSVLSSILCGCTWHQCFVRKSEGVGADMLEVTEMGQKGLSIN